MAVSTQKLIIVMLMISMMASVADYVNQNPDAYSTAPFVTRINTFDSISDDIADEADEEIPVEKQGYNLDNTFGNTLRMGANFFSMFANAFNPFVISPMDHHADNGGSELEYYIAFMLVWLRILMNLLLVFEVYMVFKNKKAS